jgi:uncharacterized protein (UPF0335 family)
MAKSAKGKRAMAEQAGADMGARSADREVEVAGIAADRLKSLIERIERLEEEKAALAGDIRDVYAEAKAVGFDTKILRKVIALRKRKPDERQEQEAILELYLQALGMKV